MMFTPWGPRAVPTGGAGVAAPPWSCTLTSAATFFLGGIPLSLSRGHDEAVCDGPCHRVLRLFLLSLAQLRDQTFWIWVKLSSTGVSRPKISTSALTRWASGLISVMVACSVANGPSTTMTEE